jgi:hypothetical protein
MTPLNVAFRRSLVGVNLQAWQGVVAMVVNVQLTNQSDRFMWGLHQNGLFSVKFMYRALVIAKVIPYNTFIWKLKLPLKIKVFFVLVQESNFNKGQFSKATVARR